MKNDPLQGIRDSLTRETARAGRLRRLIESEHQELARFEHRIAQVYLERDAFLKRVAEAGPQLQEAENRIAVCRNRLADSKAPLLEKIRELQAKVEGLKKLI